MTSVSFMAKLAAFMLNSQKTHVKCYEDVGFLHSSDFIKGVIPLLHMNLTKKQYSDILHDANGKITSSLAHLCSAAGLESSLSFENFNCAQQCAFSATILVDRYIDTIEFAYDSRSNGRARVHELATFMQLQAAKGIIPAKSVQWCKNIRPISGLALTKGRTAGKKKSPASKKK